MKSKRVFVSRRVSVSLVVGVLNLALLLPASAQSLPVVPGFSVEVYAELQVPSKLCFAPDGVMYVANRSNFWGAASAYRIEAGGGPGSVSLYGPPLWKASAVGYDKDGLISGTSGAVLSGGGMYSQSHLTAIFPDQTTTKRLWAGLPNLAGDIAFDSTGRMLQVDPESREVYQSRAGERTVLLTCPLQDCLCMAIDRNDNIFISMGHYAQAKVLAYRSDGIPIGTPILEGQISTASSFPIAFGKGGVWGHSLYVIANYVLMRLDNPLEFPGSFTTIGTGFNYIVYADMESGPDGALYVSDQMGHRILRIAPENSAPSANAGPDQTVECSCQRGGTYVTLDGTGSSDPDGDELTYEWTGEHIDPSPASGPNPTVKLLGCQGMYSIILVVNDGQEDSAPDEVVITVQDTTPPEIARPTPVTVEAEGPDGVPVSHPEIQAFLNGASASDNCDPSPDLSHNAPPDFFPLGETPVTFTAVDASGNASSVVSTVTVEDTTPPDIFINAPQPYGLYAVGNLALDFSAYDLVSGWIQPPDLMGMLSDAAQGSRDVEPGYVPPVGVYTLTVSAIDEAGNLGGPESVMCVVYDPEGGFVTGGGWLNSPAGAYRPDPLLSGRANFGFVSKYKKGASMPTGQTEFVFQTGGLNFHSSSYEWLIVTGSNYARFKGTGTINGSGAYKFMIWAGDGPDTFRIRIWIEDSVGLETDVYDNGFDQAIGGGSIVIHTN